MSVAQQRALQKLRWGLTKDLNYRGDADDATVRTLSATALAALDSSIAPAPQVVRFVSDNRDLFLLKNPEAELSVVSVESEQLGGQVVRLAQRYAGLEVWPGQMVANITAQGYLTVVAGVYAPTPESVSLLPQLSADDAIASAWRHLGLQSDTSTAPGSTPATLKIFADKGRTPELAYEVEIQAPGKHERVFVSAATGQVLLSYSEIHDAAVVGSGTDQSGLTRSLNVYADGTPQKYYLWDTSKPMYSASTGTGVIAIYDGSVSPSPISSSATLSGGFDAAAVSAAYNLGKVYDFYFSTFNRSSFDGAGATIRGYVRQPNPVTGGSLSNAYWDGLSIRFGSADYYARASDVVGHEFAHAVTSYTARLLNYGDAGALNESLADILGEAFERYLGGSNDWFIGTGLVSPLRNLKTPQNINGTPSTMSQYVLWPNDEMHDMGGVHVNCGITNHAFYLLAEGLPAGSIGFENARNIFYRALTTKLTKTSGFQDLRDACVLSATELFGSGSIQVTRTGQAFDAVEIFDATAAGYPDNFTPPTGLDSYLFSYLAVDGNTYLGRREAAFGDGASLRAISAYAVSTSARVSVSGDGSLAAFISATRDLVLAATDGSWEGAAGAPGAFNSVAVSADAKYYAYVPRDSSTGLAETNIVYYNTVTRTSDVIDLYLPVADGPNSIKITAIDEVDLSPDGQIALFDGLAKTTFADGSSIQAWSIFAVDLKAKSIYALAGPLHDIDIGNPSFARTSSARLTFEAVSSGSSYVLTADWTQGVFKTVAPFTPGNFYLAYPRFSAADDFVVFTDQFFSLSTFNYQPRVSRISLALDHLTPSGTSSVLQNLASSGLSYRRGVFAGAPTLSVTALSSSLTKGQTGSFRISRTSGDQAVRVPVTFKTLGTARPVADYGQIAPSILLPAGVAFVDVPVTATSSLGAGTRTLTLSLDPQYYYVVSPTGGSATMSIIGTGEQTITFGALADRTYGAAPFAVAATASSGLPVNISVVSGPATMTNGTLTITGAGTVALRASQPGNTSFNAAPAVDRTFTVAKATLAISADDKSRVYGAANPQLTGHYSGLVNGDSISVVTLPVLSTTATSASPAGNYPITLSGGGAANYTLSLTGGTLAVVKAPLLATAQDQTRAYGAANPAFTITYTGFVNGESASELDTPPAIATAATSGSSPGSYPITLTGGSDNSYAFSLQDGTLTVAVPDGVGATHLLSSIVADLTGGAVTISNRFTYPGLASDLQWSVLLPEGWSFVSSDASGTEAAPTTGATGLLEWRWTALPASPVTFSYSISVPAGDLASRSITALVGFKYDGTPMQLTAQTDPLTVGFTHAADTNHNEKIDVSELSRVISLYNTRFTTADGKIRTGAYSVATTTTVDGFAPDAGRDSGATATLARYHSADTNHNGRVDVAELSRVITLYNTRYTTPDGKIRTGFYKLSPGILPDGFAPDSNRPP